jgi:hypothetical protein
MKRLTWVLALVACGGSSNHSGSDAAIDSHTIDSRPIDGPIDSHPIDGPVDGPVDAPVDAAVDAPPDGIVIVDAPPDAPSPCNVLTQTGCNAGEKCTWIIDAMTPQYLGHIGCAPDGNAASGAACQFGAAGPTGYDNCVKGTVCGNYTGGAGVCKDVCDPQGGAPMCGANHACVVYSDLFYDGGTPVAAVCDPSCDPLDDNDFDGPGSALSRTGTTCGSANIGCYGYPSTSTPTHFSCATDINYTTALHHRTVLSGPLFVNSCNQGYLPLLLETTTSTNVICVAMCKPQPCSAGACGSGDVNQHGMAPHRCQTPDALGSFDTSATGEECAYWWYLETDSSTNTLTRSDYSDTLGFCFDHSKYSYDTNGDGTADTPLPPCQQLQIHATGTDPTQPLTYWGAADLGCVDSGAAGLFTGKHRTPPATGLRAPYHHAMLPGEPPPGL